VIQPDTDFSKYDKFMIQPLDIGETRLIPPPWIEGKVLFDHWGEYLRLALDAEKQMACPSKRNAWQMPANKTGGPRQANSPSPR
jgi:hypothetical protein